MTRYQDIQPDFTSVDTVAMARILLPTLSKYKLNVVANALHISLENHHRAVDDAGATAEIFVKFIEMLKDRGIYDLAKLNQFGENNADAVRKLPSYHVIILALNEVGRVNLYTLISMSHLKYYARRPRIPKSELSKYREGLLVGSACEAGELYQAILNDKSEERIAKIANFYDYLEIQPLGNNRFMIESPKVEATSMEDIIGHQVSRLWHWVRSTISLLWQPVMCISLIRRMLPSVKSSCGRRLCRCGQAGTALFPHHKGNAEGIYLSGRGKGEEKSLSPIQIKLRI